jgi:hypothetical protein
LAAGSLRLGGANEGAQESAFDVRGYSIDIDAGLAEELAGVFDVVNASGLEGDFGKAGRDEPGSVILFFKRAGDAADPEHHALANGVRDLAAHDNIRNGEAPAGPEYAKGFAQYAVFVCGKIDNAVGDDHID